MFGNLTILLCRFYVIKWLKSVISTACWADGRVVDCDEKHEMMKAFKRILYSRNEEDLERELNAEFSGYHCKNSSKGGKVQGLCNFFLLFC